MTKIILILTAALMLTSCQSPNEIIETVTEKIAEVSKAAKDKLTESTEIVEDKVVEHYLSGETIISFGDEEFLNKTVPTLQEYGVITKTAENLANAARLVEKGFLEVQCFSTEVPLIIHVYQPDQLFIDRENYENPIANCEFGLIMVNFAITQSPTVTVTN